MRILSGFFGITGVLLGAFGAHALKPQLTAANTLATWETAVHYQLLHAVALLVLSVANMTPFVSERPSLRAWFSRAMQSWNWGIILFSGSLYWIALGGPRWLWPVTPSGGLLLVTGWAFVTIALVKTKNKDPKSQA